MLVATDTIPQEKANSDSMRILIAIPLLASQFGVQVALSKGLGFSEVPTTVLTSVYADLGSDAQVLKWENVKRDRRVGSVVSLLLGGICGGWLCRSEVGFEGVLWIGGAVKMGLAMCWLIFGSEKNEEEEDTG